MCKPNHPVEAPVNPLPPPPTIDLLDLPDEVLSMIAVRLPLVELVHMLSSCKKLKELLSHWRILPTLKGFREIPTPYLPHIKSLEQLYLFEQVKAAGLLEENRIGFGFGTMDIMQDMFDDTEERDETDIRGSQARIENATRLFERHRQLTLHLDAHCGTAAPGQLAGRFSIDRGEAVLDEFEELLPPRRVFGIHAWGKRGARAASQSNHPHAALARTGKGWVEIRFGIEGDSSAFPFQLPLQPSYYQGLEPERIEWMEEEAEDDEPEQEPDYLEVMDYAEIEDRAQEQRRNELRALAMLDAHRMEADQMVASLEVVSSTEESSTEESSGDYDGDMSEDDSSSDDN